MLPVLYNPTVDKKKTNFLYPLDVHITKSGYVLFPPSSSTVKRSLTFSKIHKINIFLVPTLHYCQIIIIILIINHRVLRWEQKKKMVPVAILGGK